MYENVKKDFCNGFLLAKSKDMLERDMLQGVKGI